MWFSLNLMVYRWTHFNKEDSGMETRPSLLVVPNTTWSQQRKTYCYVKFSKLLDKARERKSPFSSLCLPIVLWTSLDFGKSAAWIHPSLLQSSPSVFSAGRAINLQPVHINARCVLIITHACRVCHLTERVWGPTCKTGQRTPRNCNFFPAARFWWPVFHLFPKSLIFQRSNSVMC